jgi:hypothetical protein
MWCPDVSRQPAGLKQWVTVQKPLVPKSKAQKHQMPTKVAPQDGYLKVLDKALIMESQATEGTDACSELESVLRIDLRGCNVHKLEEEALLSCMRLRICNLSNCHLQNIGALYGSINLLKLDLSNNQVSCEKNTCLYTYQLHAPLPPRSQGEGGMGGDLTFEVKQMNEVVSQMISFLCSIRLFIKNQALALQPWGNV